MIKQFIIKQGTLELNADLAGEYPMYLYLSDDKQTLLYSRSVIELINDVRVERNLVVSIDSLSFLLQSGVVPTPHTVFKNIFILGIGDKLTVTTENSQIRLTFEHEFPFKNTDRLSVRQMKPDKDWIFNMLAEAVMSRLDKNKPAFLFHSAGKDSNPIAIALAKAGKQDQVTLITHKTKKKGDESEISKSIAKRLGFRHHILHEIDKLTDLHKEIIKRHFAGSPFPCSDNVSLVYPLYVAQMPELSSANIIDGMGNDVFIGHVPSKYEFKRQKLSNALKYLRWLSRFLPSGSRINGLIRTRSEWTGLGGLSLKDTRKILPKAKDVSGYWQKRDSNIDYIEFRASVRGQLIDQEIYMRKVRNFADAFDSNVIFPWSNQNIARYFSKMPEEYLVDRRNLRNKVLLREIINQEIDLDSDKLGKIGFSYDSKAIVVENLDWIESEIIECEFWESKGVRSWFDKQKTLLKKRGLISDKAAKFIYRIFLITLWLNHCRFINKKQSQD